MEYQNNATLISPRTLNELITAISKNPDAVLFAGGTYIMSQPDYYPNRKFHGYISLSQIAEFHKIIHTEKFLEVGCMVTLNQLLNVGTGAFSKELYGAIESIGTSVLKNQITLGGSLCTLKKRYSMSCILSAINAQAEVKFISGRGLFKKVIVHSRWIPVDRLYDSDGRFLYSDNAILTRIRIPSDPHIFLKYKEAGSVVKNPENAVIVTFQYDINQNSIITPSFCISFINNGIFILQDFENIIRSIKFPLSTESIQKVSTELKKMIEKECPNVNKIQAERARRLTLECLFESNNTYLSS